MTDYTLQARKCKENISVGAGVKIYSRSREIILLESQLFLARKHHLPLFLHSRAAHDDLVRILREEGFGSDGGRPVGGKGGVVHSFTGTSAEVEELVRSVPVSSTIMFDVVRLLPQYRLTWDSMCL